MYTAKNFSELLGLEGFSDNALQTHFKLYEGYVSKTNELGAALERHMKEKTQTTPEFAELRRRFGWEWNGMRLHEYYFDALKKGGVQIDSASELSETLKKHFGSFENWKQDFIATASMRGIGWGILYYDKESDVMYNDWVNEHDHGHLAGATLLLNIDIFEHVFMLDYGTNRPDYITAYMNAIDWKKVEQRFMDAR